MTGFARADIRALYRRDWVALEGPETHGIMKRAASPEEFRRGLQAVNWDELQLAQFERAEPLACNAVSRVSTRRFTETCLDHTRACAGTVVR
jgi:hypothetical protein